MVTLDEYLERESFIKANDLPLADIKEYWPSLLPVSTLESRIDLIVNQLGLDKKVLNFAPIFGLSDENIYGRVDLIINQLGLDKKVLNHAQIFSYSDDRINGRVDLIINQLSLDKKVLNFAAIFGYSDANITGTVGFLRTIISDEKINNWPAYIGCSLKRMRECYEHLTITMGYDKEELNLNKIIWSISKQNVIDNKSLIDQYTNLPDKFNYQDNPNILLQKPAQLRKQLKKY